MKILLTTIRRICATAVLLFLAACCSIGLAWVLTSTPYGFESATSDSGERLWLFSGLIWQAFFVLCYLTAKFILYAWELTGDNDMQEQIVFNFDTIFPELTTAPTGDELKREALAAMEGKHSRWIDFARDKARKHCIIYGRVSSNDINEMIANGELPAPPHFNAMGAVFRKGFRKIGIEEVKHASARNRGGGVTVWGLA